MSKRTDAIERLRKAAPALNLQPQVRFDLDLLLAPTTLDEATLLRVVESRARELTAAGGTSVTAMRLLVVALENLDTFRKETGG